MNGYKNLLQFWDNNFKVSQYDDSIVENDLVPNNIFVEELSKFKNLNCLDYGAGNGWASYILAHNNNVLSVDSSKNAIDIIEHYKVVFELDSISTLKIDTDWISKTNDKFDLIFCSNVLDVLPLDISKDIISNFNRILNNNGFLIVGLNYYLDLEIASKAYTLKGKEVYIDDILRLVSLTDDEWEDIFSSYFDVIELKHFSWPGEINDSRRLFVLKKK